MAIVKEVSYSEDFKVQIVTSSPDICIYVTKNKYEADNSDIVWYFDSSNAKRKIKFVTNSPDLEIQYVDSKYSAG